MYSHSLRKKNSNDIHFKTNLNRSQNESYIVCNSLLGDNISVLADMNKQQMMLYRGKLIIKYSQHNF